jgi:hypothetical protein
MGDVVRQMNTLKRKEAWESDVSGYRIRDIGC